MVEPIKPSEALGERKFPDAVIEAFNECIKRNLRGNYATIKQDEVITEIVARIPLSNREYVFDNHLLDVEDVYRKHGWSVKYEKPSIGDSFDAYFEFRIPPQR